MAQIGYIQITRNCNQKCLFCSNPPTGKKISFNKARELVVEFKKSGFDEIIFTGGEPTIVDWLDKIIHFASTHEIKTRIITNGSSLWNVNYLDKLINSGLNHIHLSIHSHDAQIQDTITSNKGSFSNLMSSLQLISYYKIPVDINCTICSLNAKKLYEFSRFITNCFPFIKHIVFNGLDTSTDRCRQNHTIIPRLIDFEVSLINSLKYLQDNNITFRVERVPLCYLSEFEYVSTETRKLVKNERRSIFFLDEKQRLDQKGASFKHKYYKTCQICTLKNICAGLFSEDIEDINSLYPRFINPEIIINKILCN